MRGVMQAVEEAARGILSQSELRVLKMNTRIEVPPHRTLLCMNKAHKLELYKCLSIHPLRCHPMLHAPCCA